MLQTHTGSRSRLDAERLENSISPSKDSRKKSREGGKGKSKRAWVGRWTGRAVRRRSKLGVQPVFGWAVSGETVIGEPSTQDALVAQPGMTSESGSEETLPFTEGGGGPELRRSGRFRGAKRPGMAVLIETPRKGGTHHFSVGRRAV